MAEQYMIGYTRGKDKRGDDVTGVEWNRTMDQELASSFSSWYLQYVESVIFVYSECLL